jgi:hypothetical protein
MSDSTDARNEAIARFVENWCRVTRRDQAQSRSRGAGLPSTRRAESSETPDAIAPGRLDAAARWAPMAFPGPVGELIAREIDAYLSFGLRFGGGGFIASVAEQVLTTGLPAGADSKGAVLT